MMFHFLVASNMLRLTKSCPQLFKFVRVVFETMFLNQRAKFPIPSSKFPNSGFKLPNQARDRGEGTRASYLNVPPGFAEAAGGPV